MTHEQAAERRALVRRVRAEFRPHFFTRCLEIAYRVIPCCKSCEHNKAGICAAPPLTFEENSTGLAIKDGESLCLQWSPAPEAIIAVLQYAYLGNKIQDEQSRPADNVPSQINAEFAEQIHRLKAGETTVAQAAQKLGISSSCFYAKARAAGQPLSEIPHRKANNDELTEQIRLFHAGIITATQAAQSMGISLGAFYKKARSFRRSQAEQGEHSPENAKNV